MADVASAIERELESRQVERLLQLAAMLHRAEREVLRLQQAGCEVALLDVLLAQAQAQLATYCQSLEALRRAGNDV